MADNGQRQLKLGIFLQGGGGHWREEGVRADGAARIETYQEYARIGEAGKFDFGFIADSAYITKDSTIPFLSRLEPMTALSAVAAVTKHLGLVGTFTTSYSEPFTTARQLASLDVISDGRAGWNAVTSALEGVARNHGHDKLHDHALRYRIAAEYIEVVRGLWNSWEDGAFPRNKETGEYVDLDKLHTLNHVGEFFKVQGPLNIERSKQGHPVIFQAGASDTGRDLAARYADAIFSSFEESGNIAKAQEQYQDVKRRAAAYGRDPEKVLLFPSIAPIVASTREEAERLYEEGNRFTDPEYAVKYLSRYFSFFDFSQFPLDEPLPELGDIGKNSFRSTAEYYLRIAKEENLTLRQLALRATNPRGDFVGTPEYVADKIERFFKERAVDGFILSGSHANLRNFVDRVVPILQERGLFRKEYEADTLRGHLGLDFPENRYALERRGVLTR
ncbi:LLM class flavin-dependent oxidoreductase [Cohnella thailandensis]|uniref:LLM class flavin-dependent oxidoreductase n=1 Tax=Cohnella thailandensis TaxID=557557 RepID=A0A841SS70_9BACL|nr:LLM class flavin-dependent oxidoreductase [Cohnella thailandensis]MBB6634784.1 LLM class flavin-dependent oxidoreductase [Cohnella thailandensis]MBP1975995.1 FMN-dependent oxidoreductase (nitrilotriacetate monooxygenase family) [Cohnella thailandensis]